MQADTAISFARVSLDRAGGDVQGRTFLEHIAYHIGIALVYAILAIALAIMEKEVATNRGV